MRHYQVQLAAYEPRRELGVAATLWRSGCSLAAIRWAEPYGAELTRAWDAALRRLELRVVLPLALARGRTPTEVGKVGARWVEHLLGERPAALSESHRGLVAAGLAAAHGEVDPQLCYVASSQLVQTQPIRGYHLVHALSASVGLVGRRTQHAGGEAERIGEQLQHALVREDGELRASIVIGELCNLARVHLGPRESA